MSVYLGTFGKVELQRQFDGGELFSTINPSDVNATRKRFSFDFKHGQLLTGDQVEITSTNAAALSFISGYTKTSVKKFLHIDELDGIRLYDTFANAINGGVPNATALAVPAADIPIRIKVENADFKLLAQVKSYELNTERETVDTTTLSDDFRSRISTLMSGSGRMSCFWEYTGDTVNELPQYLVQLALRTKVGSQFKARFYLSTIGYNPGGAAGTVNDEIWYEFTGVLTACATQFTPSNVVEIAADFITTGDVSLKVSLTPFQAMLQENSDDILLDQDGTAKLMLDSSDI
jgi:hypothetical protein